MDPCLSKIWIILCIICCKGKWQCNKLLHHIQKKKKEHLIRKNNFLLTINQNRIEYHIEKNILSVSNLISIIYIDITPYKDRHFTSNLNINHPCKHRNLQKISFCSSIKYLQNKIFQRYCKQHLIRMAGIWVKRRYRRHIIYVGQGIRAGFWLDFQSDQTPISRRPPYYAHITRK